MEKEETEKKKVLRVYKKETGGKRITKQDGRAHSTGQEEAIQLETRGYRKE